MASDPTNSHFEILAGDCLQHLRGAAFNNIAVSFVDPPFRQGKSYRFFDDDQPEEMYWEWMKDVLRNIKCVTVDGGGVYFMQREKNTEQVLRALREAGWTYQNLIIWKKKTSAVPCEIRFAKQYQVIAFATKGAKPRVFNKLRVDLPLAPEHKYARANGVYLTDVWDDIRELTSGYFAGNEAIRELNGDRAHVQQSPVSLLLRIILSSSMPGDTILDPFAGTGTTLVAAEQLGRRSVGIEIDSKNVGLIEQRLKQMRQADDVSKFRNYYRFTNHFSSIWPVAVQLNQRRQPVDV
ncbi:MAG: site-specific DNA-methyltransferase [Chloroflexi bacterium]|nr:site-specific DNA-methyltransferase [Chloroflexota bacterium]